MSWDLTVNPERKKSSAYSRRNKHNQPAWPGEQLNCGNRWLGVAGDQALATPFQTGAVVLPRDINSWYLHSDRLAGFRDTMGPVPNTRGTVCKISLGQTKFKEYHAESVFRPHLYSTLPMSTLNQIDFPARLARCGTEPGRNQLCLCRHF